VVSFDESKRIHILPSLMIRHVDSCNIEKFTWCNTTLINQSINQSVYLLPLGLYHVAQHASRVNK